jgi:hypothetical protein
MLRLRVLRVDQAAPVEARRSLLLVVVVRESRLLDHKAVAVDRRVRNDTI